MKKFIFCVLVICSHSATGQKSISVNVLKPAFYYSGKQDFMTELTFTSYITRTKGLRIGFHGGYQNAPSGLPVMYFDSSQILYTLEKSKSFVLAASVAFKYHPMTISGYNNPHRRFYWLLQLQAGRSTDIQTLDVLYPCCQIGDVTYNLGFLKLGLIAGYDISIKRWQFEPELGVMFPWASQIGISNDKGLGWVNQIKFQWHVGLNAGYVFRQKTKKESRE